MFKKLLKLFSNVRLNLIGDSINKYKLSDIIFYDERNHFTYDVKDPFMASLISLKPAGYFTKQQMDNEIQSLIQSGMFNKVDLVYRTNRDNTLAVTILFSECTWPKSDYFRCFNLGKNQQKKARPSLLPPSIELEVVVMMEEEISGRHLYTIKEKVEKWYHDEGYICAQVIKFENMGTEELVCEVFEGEIGELVFTEQNTTHTNITSSLEQLKKLCKDVGVGHVYNTKTSNLVLANLTTLGLFSSIQVIPQIDDINGEVIVEIAFHSKELEKN